MRLNDGDNCHRVHSIRMSPASQYFSLAMRLSLSQTVCVLTHLTDAETLAQGERERRRNKNTVSKEARKRGEIWKGTSTK